MVKIVNTRENVVGVDAATGKAEQEAEHIYVPLANHMTVSAVLEAMMMQLPEFNCLRARTLHALSILWILRRTALQMNSLAGKPCDTQPQPAMVPTLARTQTVLY